MKGLVIGGKYGELIARQKSNEDFEVGELLIAEGNELNKEKTKVIVQVFDLLFGSQISQQNRELISGMVLEENTNVELIDPELRQYTIATLKELVTIKNQKPSMSKNMPSFFSQLRIITKDDFNFLETPKNPLYIGELRSGSKKLDVQIKLDGKKVLSHHLLIPATTGRGKSNLLKVLLWNLVEQDYCGMLVLDPHDEYYRPEISLSAHPKKDKVHYYSPDPTPGANSLIFNLKLLRPSHFNGVAEWTAPQREALSAYHKTYKKEWISAIVLEHELKGNYHEATLGVVRRRIMNLLNLEKEDDNIIDKGIFKLNSGISTTNDILDKLERAETVVIDTSSTEGAVEILIGSIVASEALKRYKNYKTQGVEKPVISIVLEEAPRVLGKEVLEKGPNIFSTIAREGRKFNIGLVAITQLPSLIPRQVLANMNTKIILGIEMKPERDAIIQSAAQDLSKDDRNIASLDKGEAIITTNFAPFALPIKVPFFDESIKIKNKETPRSFSGVKL